MKNQREIIRNIRSMSVYELLDLVVYNPFFLTDAYYVETPVPADARRPGMHRNAGVIRTRLSVLLGHGSKCRARPGARR